MSGSKRKEATMDLDSTGWPELPTAGSRIRFINGEITLTILGECTVVRADHVRNAAGKPGGRVILRSARGEFVSVTLSQLRTHAELISDGLDELKNEAARRWAEEHG